MGYKFIDVSSWQHPGGASIDFGEVKAEGFAGVIVKATQGAAQPADPAGYVNPYLHGDVQGALAAGLLVGAYHYATPAKNPDWQTELDHFATTVGGLDLELGWWLDWEDAGGQPWGQLAGWCQSFLDAMAGKAPLSGLYTNQSALRETFGAPWTHHLWIADPSGTYEGDAWARQLAPGAVPGVPSPTCDVDDLLAGRGINPNGADAPEQPPATQPPVEQPPVEQPPTGTTSPQQPVEVTVNVPQVSAANPGPEIVSEAVKAAQAILGQKFGENIGPVDGRFGPRTSAAVEAVQTNHGLHADGIIGPDTWNLLLNG